MTQLFYLKLVNTLLKLGESWDPGVDALARILAIGVKPKAVSLVRCWLLEPKMQDDTDDRESQFKGVMCPQWARRRSEPPVWSHERHTLSLCFCVCLLFSLRTSKTKAVLEKHVSNFSI